MTSLLQDLDQSSPATSSAKPRRQYGPVVVAAAVAICVGGLGWAGWTVYESTRAAPRPKSASDIARQEGRARGVPREVHAGGQATSPGSEQRVSAVAPATRTELPIPPTDAVFTPVTNAEQANAVLLSLGAAVGEGSTKVEGLTPTPLQTSEQLNDAVKIFLGPLLMGEVKDVPAFLVANGAKPPESGPSTPMLERISNLLKFCELDPSRAKVQRAPEIQGMNRMPKLPPGAIPMMMNNQQRDDGTGVSSLMMPLAGLLPESAAGVAEKAPRVEVLVPAKLKDPQFAGKPFQLGLILAFNAGKNRWVPEMLQFHTTDLDTVKALSRTILPRSSAGGGTGAKAPSDGPR